ncbi:MAG TPA: DegT/DnrJ/EryC1/StrS family aminotransferase [Solirubrobacteraceae bacterium]|nr:DegT/DnrJ/EryC1/StrS family aminotransferase [Solirubrobacteraceae bacterium]
MVVPLFDTRTPLAPLRVEIDAAIRVAVDDGRFVLGPNVAAFEEEFAAYCGADHAVGVGNGTDALTIALRAMGVGPGDEVVVPSFTFYASTEAIPPTGARPVFCDIDPDTFCVTQETVRAALTPHTKAVVVVHLFGNVAPVAAIEALGVPVLEDAAQAAGSMNDAGRPGALGTAATFSFFPSKNLGCFGDGGAITTRDAEVADRARMLRFHGSYDKVTYEHVGYNSRLDDLQAAILRVQLPHLDGWADGRRAAGEHYRGAGLGELVTLPRAVDGCSPAWHLYVVRSERADQLAAGLSERGIGHKAYYRTPVHRQPAMREYSGGLDLPATDEVARTHLAIPMSPVLDADQARTVAGAVTEALGARTERARPEQRTPAVKRLVDDAGGALEP